MKMETQAELESKPKNKQNGDADKYVGFVEPEISDILKDSTFLSLIKSDGIAIDNFLSIINVAKVNL